ncbi:MAG: leucine--tRNA ligase [Armatimonadota bacterium]
MQNRTSQEERYDFRAVEKKWQRFWEENNSYATERTAGRPKHYNLEMFAYPSGDLHWGHVRCYTVGDAAARYKIMRGFQVLHPPGFDAFGLNAENAAIKRKIHPAEWTEKNIARMEGQLKRLGFSYDWSREIITSHPDYYKWTQWLFLQLYKAGLAYKRMAPVNWCPSCATALANEQVINGLCERCDTPVTKKQMEQWFLRITDYADRLLENHDQLEWPEDVKAMQRNWIGRSTGVEITFTVKDTGQAIPVFTTRPDTLFGVTYLVLAPEHPLVEELTKGTPIENEVRAFVERVVRISEIERTAEGAPKEGMPIGAMAVNPANGEAVPIWIANYVLMEYGTGAVMGVPAHDTRDFAFAKQNGLEIRTVILPPGADLETLELQDAYVDPGIQVNSGQFDGMPSEEAKEAIAGWLEARGVGRRKVNYRLRDWLISRQRYWGAPIPIVYCDSCGEQPVPEDQLPVLLPADVEFTGKGQSPLAYSKSFVNTTCPACGGPAKRDVDTMDTFVDSSWYFLRYVSPRRDDVPWDPEQVQYWLPVDQYVGGREHATMHLIYARFITMALHDLGLLPFEEPFTRLFNQGIIYLHGKKMSKSRGNVVPPDALCDKYGADAARCFILFIAPADEQAEWVERGIEGVYRFLGRSFRFFAANAHRFRPNWRDVLGAPLGAEDRALRRRTHQTLARVTEDIERFHFNTAISALMEMMNEMYDRQGASDAVLSEAMEVFALMLSPFAPHLAEELWHRIGREGEAAFQQWPEFDPEAARAEEIEIVVQVNGKVRDRLTVPADTSEKDLEHLALASDRVKALLDGKQVRKVIVVPGRLVNVVIG